MDTNTQLNVFKLLMTGHAADWLNSLKPTEADTMEHIKMAFQRRFAMTELHKLHKLSQWQRNQLSTETVDEYVTSLQNAARLIPIQEPELIRLALIRGLLPNIKLHVIQANAQTLDDVIRAARLAEEALIATGANTDNNSITELTKSVTQLVSQMQQQQTASASATTTTPPSTQVSVIKPKYINQQQQQQQSFHRGDRPRMPSSIFQRNFSRQPTSMTNTRPQYRYRMQTAQPFAQPSSRFQGNYMQQQQLYQPTRMTHNTCGNCAKQHVTGTCPAQGAQCLACLKWGHFARACRSSRLTTRYSH
jgi:hypothetical protein